jgi:hypothetical protein
MSESFQIYLNSTNADNINNNIYNFILPNLEIADENYIYLSVQYASIPYSFYNINTTNNVLIYTLNLVNYTVTITPGNYNITQLVTFLKSNMSGFTISYNSITNKMTFSHSTYNFTFLSTSTCQEILGFKTNTNYTSTTLSLISMNCVSLIPIKCINIVSNLLTYNINKSNPNNQSILCCMPITTQPNSIIEYKNNNNFRSNLFINQISNITIKLADQNNNILNLNGLDFFLTIQLDIEKFN